MAANTATNIILPGKQAVNRQAAQPYGTAPYLVPAVIARSPFDITADSEPNNDAWGPDTYWSCSDFMAWHKLNVAAYGTDVANQKFLDNWSKLDAFDSNYNWCKYDRGFADYFAEYGIDVSNIFSSVYNAVGNIGNTIGNVAGGAQNLTATLKWLMPIILIIALTIASIWAYKKFAQ